MSYTLIVSPAFQQDLAAAAAHYGSIAPSLVSVLLDEIEQTCKALQFDPLSPSFFANSNTLRQYQLKSFPYCMVFASENKEVSVLGLYQLQQNPDSILQRAQ